MRRSDRGRRSGGAGAAVSVHADWADRKFFARTAAFTALRTLRGVINSAPLSLSSSVTMREGCDDGPASHLPAARSAHSRQQCARGLSGPRDPDDAEFLPQPCDSLAAPDVWLRDNSGSLHSFLAPTVLLADGGQNVRDALNGAAGVIATLSDDDAKSLVAAIDLTHLDIAGMATLLGNTLQTNISFEEPVVLAIAGWVYSFSQQYANKKADRFGDGEAWDIPDGCLPTELLS